MNSCFKAKNQMKKDEKMLMRNGGTLLERLTSFTNGKSHSIGRSFSLSELRIATRDFDQHQVILDTKCYALYKGILQDRVSIIKKYKDEQFAEDCFTDIVFSSQMKVHKNVLKLLGCCLESPVPILIFEYAEKLSLDSYISNRANRADFQPLSWKNRLKIAVDVASVIAYLHTAFPRPIVHGGLMMKVILLDENFEAKVSDFSFARSIPEGETHIKDDIAAPFGYLAPEYAYSGEAFNQQVDVYSFGVILLVLLTGKNPFHPFPARGDEYFDFLSGVKYLGEKDRFENIFDPKLVCENIQEEQLKDFVKLAFECTRANPGDRPEITYVGKQLREMLISNSIHQM